MKVAIVRGPSLNKFEMQYYEPLAKRHQLVCFTSLQPVYEAKSIKLPIVKLACYGQLFGRLPGGIKLLNLIMGDPQGLIGLTEKLKGFDLIHTAELFSYYTHQALIAKKKGWVKKVMATVSENIPFNQEATSAQKALKKEALAGLDHIIAISDLSRKMLLKEGFRQKKISVIGHGIDLNRFRPKTDRLLDDRMKILFVGRLVPEKGIWELLEAFRWLNKSYPRVRLMIVGEGKEREAIEQWIANNDLALKITLKGQVSYSEIPGIYRQADIFVLPSRPTKVWHEQFGMVLLEAMACGLPIIATNSGAIRETIGKAGILVEPDDIQQLRKTLRRLILDNYLRIKLGKMARLRAEKHFDREIISRKIEKVWKRIMNNES